MVTVTVVIAVFILMPLFFCLNPVVAACWLLLMFAVMLLAVTARLLPNLLKLVPASLLLV